MDSATSQAAERSFLERSMSWWHIGYSVFVSGAVLAWLLTPDLAAGRRALGIALIGVGVLAYVLVGRRLAREEGPKPVVRMAYALLICLLTLLLIELHEFNHVLLFVAFPHIWMTLYTRWAVVFSSVLTGLVIGLPIVDSGWTAEAVVGGLVTGVATAGLGVLLGLWITGIVTESEKRKHLIAELERARAELAEAHRREGVLAERERLATEIHDTLAQGFMSILMLSQAPEAPERMDRIERTARENLAEARALIEALSPAELRNGTLAEACARVVARWDSGVEASFRLEGEPRTLPANSEVVLLRATQEALTNVAKHSNAEAVKVVLTYAETSASVLIVDDGCGFDLTALGTAADGTPVGGTAADGTAADGTAADGFGLRGMRNRVKQVNGSLTVDSRPGHGTAVRVEV